MIKRFSQKFKTSTATRQITLTIVAGIIISGCFVYWLYSRNYASTDDAYVNANVVQIACRVSGQITTLNSENNQFVQKGQLLFSLDPGYFKVAVDKARAQLSMAEATLLNAQLTANRVTGLVAKTVLSKQDGDNATANLQNALAATAVAKSNLAQAELDLAYSSVTAPTSGWITNMNLRNGSIVTANQPLFALVSNNEYWVDANFKETELQRIIPGQKAEITLDMYPDRSFKGVVESISSGSGTVFSLLPPQNAVGNWVKVTQRIPVKIRILDMDQNYPLRIGTTASVTIHLKKR